MMSSIDKTIIYPKVVVYNNLLQKTDKIVEMLKESKNATEDTYHLTPWVDWKPMGNLMVINDDNWSLGEEPNEEKKYQEDLLKEIYKAFSISTEDFFERYSSETGWPDFIKTFDRSYPAWSSSRISFLRYDPTNYNFDSHTGKPGLAMDYHTDTHEFNADAPGKKFVVTATMYLNDDYDGGEVSFLDEESGSVTDYKPKAGDVTVFPSGAPYYHGIKPIAGNERYLLRMFWYYYFEGTETWHENQNKYGKELWQSMENERISKAFDSGEYHRVAVMPGESFDPSTQRSKPFYVKEVR
jgi:hypothetical protein